MLIERHGFLGGMGTAALVHTICGLYCLSEEPGAEYANIGFASEFAERLQNCGGASAPVRMGRVDVLPHDPVAYASLADDLVRETLNLQTMLHAEIHTVEQTDVGWRVHIISRGTRLVLEAAAIVDATGDATLAHLAGIPTIQTEAALLQRPAYVFKLCGVTGHLLDDDARLKLAHAIAFAVRDGGLAKAALGAGFRKGMHAGECFITLDLAGESVTSPPYDPTDPACLTEVEQTGRALAVEFVQWLVNRAEGFQHAWIVAWPTRAGVRESRSVVGQYQLTEDDLLSGHEFEDSIAQAAWPIELREKPIGPKWIFPTDGKLGMIPLRCIRSAVAQNFFVAGRCLSATHRAQGSIRVMGTCMATGEAAGLAAASIISDPALAFPHGWTALAAHVRSLRAKLHSQRKTVPSC